MALNDLQIQELVREINFVLTKLLGLNHSPEMLDDECVRYTALSPTGYTLGFVEASFEKNEVYLFGATSGCWSADHNINRLYFEAYELVEKFVYGKMQWFDVVVTGPKYRKNRK